MNKYRSLSISLISLLSLSLITKGQSLEPFNPYGIFSPNVEAWQMIRYGGLTPSLYTGAMSYSLPLYTYEDSDFTIPISIDYSFDGYRPDQHSGIIGYGWRLNCGGVITREIRGLPDEGVVPENHPNNQTYQVRICGWIESRENGIRGPYNINEIWSAHRLRYDSFNSSDYVSGFQSCGIFSDSPALLRQPDALMTSYDMQPDLWHFNFLGHSGDFMMMEDGSVKVFNSDFPEGQVDISFNIQSNIMNSITIHTGDGYEYVFNKSNHSYTYGDITQANTDNEPNEAVTAWSLTRITAPNGRYAVFHLTTEQRLSSKYRYARDISGVWDNGSIDAIDIDSQHGTIASEQPDGYTLIKDYNSPLWYIVFNQPDGESEDRRIVFVYERIPADEFDAGNYMNPNAWMIGSLGRVNRLKEIQVYQCQFLGERVVFSQFCAPSGTPKMFLSSVSTLKSGKWSFSYNLDGYTLPKNDTQSTDHWGYWNGSSISDLRTHLLFPGRPLIQEGYYTMSPDSIQIYVPPVYGDEIVVNHLYDQMADNAKEANPIYSKCGALTRITYPTGGYTDIEYEGNTVAHRINAYQSKIPTSPADSVTVEWVNPLNHWEIYSVGGLRVHSTTDYDTNGSAYNRTFDYTDENGHNSGILMQMPKYLEDALYTHQANDIHGLIHCNALIGINLISGGGTLCLGGDGPIAYSDVKETHPDGSVTVHRFTNINEPGMRDERSLGCNVTKRVISRFDWIEPYDPHASDDSFIVVDRRNMRGKPKEIINLDASGKEVARKTWEYAYMPVSISEECRNGKYYYHLLGYSIRSPRTVSVSEMVHGVEKQENYFYNSKGQTICKEVIRGDANSLTADTTRTYFHYLHESNDPTWFANNPTLRSAMDGAVKTVVTEGRETVIQAEQYQYSHDGNPKPAGINSFCPVSTDHILGPTNRDALFCLAFSTSPRSSGFTYDQLFRISNILLPGGRTVSYVWDGHNLSSVTNNGESSTHYDWIDLIGPVSITSPIGYTTHYSYDDNNRLQSISDQRTNRPRTIITEYNYHLKNDEPLNQE